MSSSRATSRRATRDWGPSDRRRTEPSRADPPPLRLEPVAAPMRCRQPPPQVDSVVDFGEFEALCGSLECGVVWVESSEARSAFDGGVGVAEELATHRLQVSIALVAGVVVSVLGEVVLGEVVLVAVVLVAVVVLEAPVRVVECLAGRVGLQRVRAGLLLRWRRGESNP